MNKFLLIPILSMLPATYSNAASIISQGVVQLNDFSDLSSHGNINYSTNSGAIGNGALTVGSGIGFQVSNTDGFSDQKGTGRVVMSVTLSIDASSIVIPSSGCITLFDTSERIPNSAGSQHWGLGISSEGKLQGTWSAGNTHQATTFYNLGDYVLPATGDLVLTLTAGEAGSILYVNGAQVGASTALKWGQWNRYFLTLGSQADGSSVADGLKVNSMYIHGRDLNAAEVAELYSEIQSLAPIPEPATVTTGLLGLVALLMRRRKQD